MKVELYWVDYPTIEVGYNVKDCLQSNIKDVPEDVLDRHELAVKEYMAVKRILELYKNEG